MKCRDVKLHDDKFLKENLAYELQYREAHYGRAGGKKRKRYPQYEGVELAGDGADPGERLGYDGGSSGKHSEFPAEIVLAGETATDRGADDFKPARETDKDFNSADGEPRTTGWEESRKEFERFLGKGFAVGNGYRQGSETTELENLGVKPIEAIGQEFNPDFHNAVMQVESEEYDTGVIAQELQKGYTYRDSVVRHSMVAVVS